MATQQQIDANRRNAEKSTGPVTPAGKDAVRHNAVRHGLRSRSLNLSPGKDAAYTELCTDLENAWHPLDRPEQIQVEAMAIAYWKLTRLERDANAYLETLDPLEPKTLRFQAQITQVQASIERSYSRAQRDLERLQKTRAARAPQLLAPSPQPPAPALNQSPDLDLHQTPAPSPQPAHPAPSPQPLAAALNQPPAPALTDLAFRAAPRESVQGPA
jgi:hypothetical protein